MSLEMTLKDSPPTLQPVLPRWESHKKVRGAKITKIRDADDGYTTLELDDGKYVVRVSNDWRMRDLIEVGGYYVEYSNNYKSYCPGAIFEAENTRVD